MNANDSHMGVKEPANVLPVKHDKFLGQCVDLSHVFQKTDFGKQYSQSEIHHLCFSILKVCLLSYPWKNSNLVENNMNSKMSRKCTQKIMLPIATIPCEVMLRD